MNVVSVCQLFGTMKYTVTFEQLSHKWINVFCVTSKIVLSSYLIKLTMQYQCN
jgi:hypothetical protein